MKPMASALGLLLLGTAIGLSLGLFFSWHRVGGSANRSESPALHAAYSGEGAQIAAPDTNNEGAKQFAAPGRPEGSTSGPAEAVVVADARHGTGDGSAGPGVPPAAQAEANRGATSPTAYVGDRATASGILQDPVPRAMESGVRQALLAFPSELVVPTGAKVPAVFLEDRPLPAPQRGFLERVADRFIETVSQAAPGQEQEVWEEARNKADQEYIKLYGFEEFDALHRSAALDALPEKRAMGLR
jgi:hypothetical protein